MSSNSPRHNEDGDTREPLARQLRAVFNRDLAADGLAAVVGAFAFGWLGSEAVFIGALLGGATSKVVRILVQRWRTRSIVGASGLFALADLWHLARAPAQAQRAVTGHGAASAAVQGAVTVSVCAVAAVGVLAVQTAFEDEGDTSALAAVLPGQWDGGGEPHFFKVDGDRFTAAYGDTGRITGVIDGDRLRGWWSEGPSRSRNAAEAGFVEFELVRPGPRPRLRGRWNYGSSDLDSPGASWTHIAWNLERVGNRMPPALRAAFDDPDSFVEGPDWVAQPASGEP